MIMHIDMDAFFASVEQASNPKLKNKPIAVSSSSERGVIITSSYEARKYGVKTGLSVFEATKLCPHLIIIPGNFQKYVSTSKKIIDIFRKYGVTEVFSIDEAFIDIGDNDPIEISRKIKEEIKKNFDITCSIGVGVNKDIAKLASNINKPNGFFWVKNYDQIIDIPINEVCGIGKKNSQKLALLSIRVIGDFINAKDEILRSIMGIQGIKLKMALKGLLVDRIKEEFNQPKSLSNSMTLPKDIWKKEEIDIALFQLSEKIGYRLRKNNLAGRKILLHIRFFDFTSVTVDKKYYEYTNDDQEIYNKVQEILSGIQISKPVRLLGITVADLSKPVYQSFFDNRNRKRIEAIDKVRERWGFSAITWGILGKRFGHKPPISPAWRPEKI